MKEYLIDIDENNNFTCITHYGSKIPVRFTKGAKEKLCKIHSKERLLEDISNYYNDNYDSVKDVWLNQLDFQKIADIYEQKSKKGDDLDITMKNSFDEYIHKVLKI